MTERLTNLVFFSTKEETASLFKSRVMPVLNKTRTAMCSSLHLLGQGWGME